MEKIVPISESFWDFKGQGDYTDQKLLMSSPVPIVCILITYLWFILKFGPEFMKNRKPYNLGNILVIYNAIQVIYCYYILQYGVKLLYQFGIWNATCFCQKKEVQNLIFDGGHYYFLSKVIDLLDTIFFVLRKKENQVSFLHVYHHTFMVIATWTILKYNETDSPIFLGTINSLVHVVMYTYYGLSVFPALTKYLWWKKYITIMQLIQFVLMFIHIIGSHFVSQCKPTHMLLFAVCSNTVLFMYLFGNFYIKSYVEKTKTVAKACRAATSNRKITDLINQHKITGKMH